MNTQAQTTNPNESSKTLYLVKRTDFVLHLRHLSKDRRGTEPVSFTAMYLICLTVCCSAGEGLDKQGREIVIVLNCII